CNMAGVNREVDAARAVIGATNDAQYREMPRCGKKTFCCGAGGGRMWFDETPAQRVSCLRAQEALATGARALATACPFCLNMMTDGMAGTQGGGKVKVVDIAELLLSRRQANNFFRLRFCWRLNFPKCFQRSLLRLENFLLRSGAILRNAVPTPNE